MGSHRRLAPSGFDRGTAALCVLSAAAAALGAVPAHAAPDAGARAEVDRLYTEAEKATQAYDKADERAGELRRRVRTAQDRIARQQQRVNDLREQLGALAGAQYRAGGIDPAASVDRPGGRGHRDRPPRHPAGHRPRRRPAPPG
ncbi:hypothetical protein AB0N19_13670, partial [Streptomyces sp. NPDC051132]